LISHAFANALKTDYLTIMILREACEKFCRMTIQSQTSLEMNNHIQSQQITVLLLNGISKSVLFGQTCYIQQYVFFK